MRVNIEVPEFKSEDGFQYLWEDGFVLGIRLVSGNIHITANREGLISLASHLLNLAQETVPDGYHIHLDEFNSLEEGSLELVIEKKQD